VKEDCVRIAAGESTPIQLGAWQRLWALLLAPVGSKSPATVSESTSRPEPATLGGKGRARGDEREGQDARPKEG
jgi:hypothetical protein